MAHGITRAHQGRLRCRAASHQPHIQPPSAAGGGGMGRRRQCPASPTAADPPPRHPPGFLPLPAAAPARA